MYYFVDWVLTEDGYSPALPDGISCSYIASHRDAGTFAIFEVEIEKEEATALSLQRLPKNLIDLINSAKQYPPALALARNKVYKLQDLTRAAFGEALASCLHRYLAAQREHPYFLAEAKKTELGYLYAGAFYWIVGYRPDRIGKEINWVSHDFWVYQNAMSDFDIDITLLETLLPK